MNHRPVLHLHTRKAVLAVTDTDSVVPAVYAIVYSLICSPYVMISSDSKSTWVVLLFRNCFSFIQVIVEHSIIAEFETVRIQF